LLDNSSCRVALCTFAVAMSTAGCAYGDTDSPADADGGIEAVEVLRIGDALGEGPDAFGPVLGVVIDERGRLVVADGRNHDLRVFDATGEFLYRIGREGSGPGELRQPCCLALAPDGALWVRDVRNGRFNAYSLGDSSATYLHQMLIPVEMAFARGLMAPTTFDDSSRMVVIGAVRDEAGEPGSARATVLAEASAGPPAVIAMLPIPQPPNDSIGVFTVDERSGDNVSRFYLYQPYGPRLATAHAQGGDWARAVTSVPRVERYAPDGTLRHAIDVDAVPVPLSERERTIADSSMQLARQRGGGSTPFEAPESKPPLTGVHFDAIGRLWVELTVPDGEPRLAHVFDSGGNRVASVTWPAEVRLGLASYIGSDAMAGIARDSLDVEHVVVMKLQER